MIAIQGPVRLDNRNEPQPDVAVFKPRDDFYAGKPGGPTPDDVLLLIEVADSSLAYDRNRKRLRYAKSGLPDYWILDLTRERLLVFRDAAEGDYTTKLTIERGQSIAPSAFPDLPIAVDDLLGDRPVGN
jgi:Uma2 family endonuclease